MADKVQTGSESSKKAPSRSLAPNNIDVLYFKAQEQFTVMLVGLQSLEDVNVNRMFELVSEKTVAGC